MEQWTQYEGQVVDGRFPLLRYLGGNDRSGVFLTEYGGEGQSNESTQNRAVIKFVRCDAAGIARRIAAWESDAQLSHPHLLRIFAGGEYSLGGSPCAYVVTEYAGESLAMLPPDQPLTPKEARDMLAPVLSALAYLHGKGFVHGGLKPSNVMAENDVVKLSSDSVSRGGEDSSAVDLLALGQILQQCMPAPTPPFDEIVKHCLDPNPRTRWTAEMAAGRLSGDVQPIRTDAPIRPRKLPWGGIIAAGVTLLAGALWFSGSRNADTGQAPAPAVTPSASVPSTASPNTSSPITRRPDTPPAPRKPKEKSSASSSAGILDQVLPEIPDTARDTIRGKVRVNVKVSVNEEGAVTDASLEPPEASQYLSARTLRAARKWKFRPSDESQEWLLRFELLRDETLVRATQVGK